MKIKIYQIKPGAETIRLVYTDLAFVQSRCGGRVPSKFYECVYAGEVQAETLEDVFTIFNIRHPHNYRGRSLSKSDVVEVISADYKSTFHYCDTFGFTEIIFEMEPGSERRSDE